MNIALNIEIGDMVEVELSNGSIVKGKVEKENPFKIRTDATSTQVIPDALIKNISLSMAGVVGDVGSKGVTDKYTYTTPIKEIETAKKSNIESKEKENEKTRKRIENKDYDLTQRFNRKSMKWEETPENEKVDLLNEKINSDKESILLNEKIINQIKSGKLDSEINRDVNKEYYKAIDKREIEIANRFEPNQSTMQNIRDAVGNILKIKKENKFNSKGNTAYLQTEKYKIRFSDHDSRTEQDDYILPKDLRYRPKEFDREDVNVKIYKDYKGNAIINVDDNTYQISEYNINSFNDLAKFIILELEIEILEKYMADKGSMASGGKIDGGGKGSEFMFWAGLLGLGVLSYIGINKK